MREDATVATEVPDDETPAGRCPYCDRPFARERPLTIHVGEEHPDECTDEEWDAYEAADVAEIDDLFPYHLKVIGALGVTWALFVLVYMVLVQTF